MEFKIEKIKFITDKNFVSRYFNPSDNIELTFPCAVSYKIDGVFPVVEAVEIKATVFSEVQYSETGEESLELEFSGLLEIEKASSDKLEELILNVLDNYYIQEEGRITDEGNNSLDLDELLLCSASEFYEDSKRRTPENEG